MTDAIIPDIDDEVDEVIDDLPTIDMTEEEVEASDFRYTIFDPAGTRLVSGPLPHNEKAAGTVMTRMEAYHWAKRRFKERFVGMEWHPHRWVARIKR